MPTTTFDPAHKSPLIALSGGNLTADSSASGVTGTTVRSTTGKSGTEKSRVELTIVSGIEVDAVAVGIANASFVIPGTSLGADTNSFGYYSSTEILYNLSIVGSGEAYFNGDTVYIELDRGAQTATFGRVGGSAGVTVGISGLGAGAYYVAIEIPFDADVIVANFGGSPLLGVPSSGFTAWDPASGGADAAWLYAQRRRTLFSQRRKTKS